MKNLKPLFYLFLFALISCVGGSQNKDIETVKNNSLELGLGSKYVIGDLVKEITGIKGTVKWESFKPTGYEDNPNVTCVQVDITRNKENYNLVTIQYLLNRETGLVKLAAVKVDGKAKSIFDFYMLIAEIGII
jgi:hypothetical protein